MLPNDNPDSTPTRQCTKCGEWKEASPVFFYRDKRGKYGLFAQCKDCDRKHKQARANVYQEPEDPSLIPIRACPKCSNEHPWTPEYFHRNRGRFNGLSGACKKCDIASATKYQKEHPEGSRIRKTRWREKNPTYFRGYYVQHSDKIRQSVKEWYAANRERLIASSAGKKRQRRWRAANPEMARAAKLRRRARVVNAPGTHTATDIARQHKAQKGKCYWCGKRVGKSYHVDHVVPLSRGGSNDPTNLVVACKSCNSSKGAKLPHEWPQGNRLL